MWQETGKFKEQDLEIISDEAPKTLAEQLGREPSDFESKLLAHPGEQGADKRKAAEAMVEQAGFGIENLAIVKSPEAQNRLNELAIAYMEAGTIKDAQERIKTRKEIITETKAIIDKAFDEE
jgi:hypothetical protein